MEVSATSQYAGQVGDVVSGDPELNELQSEDFFSLLISQLTQQDPFEPTDNETLLNQISTIQSMEESTKLNETLEGLVQQNEENAAVNFLLTETLSAMSTQTNMSTGASLIGKEITAQMLPEDADPADPNTDMVEVHGVVTGVKMVDGDVKLQLDSGLEVSMMDVSYVGAVGAAAADASVAATGETTDDGTTAQA